MVTSASATLFGSAPTCIEHFSLSVYVNDAVAAPSYGDRAISTAHLRRAV